MKWLKESVGMGEFLPHLSRLHSRANAHGIFIAANGYTVTSPRRSCRTATEKVASCHRRQKSFSRNPVIEKSRHKIQTKSEWHGNSDTNWIVEPAANPDSSLAFFGMVSSLYPSFCTTYKSGF